MAVVINELEEVPQPAAPEPGGQKPQGPASTSLEALKMVEKAMHTKQQRNHRLEAY